MKCENSLRNDLPVLLETLAGIVSCILDMETNTWSDILLTS